MYPSSLRRRSTLAILVTSLATAGCLMPRSAPEEPPNAPAQWSDAPPVAREANAGSNVTVGIGSVVSDVDGTTESFELYQYLRAHPIEAKRTTVQVALVDSPTDAEYAVSGNVDGEVRYDEQANSGAGAGGILLTTFGGVGFGTSAILTSTGKVSSTTGGKLMIASGALVLGGIALLALENFGTPHHAYRWNQSANLTVRRRGKKIDTLVLRTQGVEESRTEMAALRQRTLARIWSELSTRLAARIDADQGGG